MTLTGAHNCCTTHILSRTSIFFQTIEFVIVAIDKAKWSQKINSPDLRPPPPLATSLARSPSWVFTRNWKSTHTHQRHTCAHATGTAQPRRRVEQREVVGKSRRVSIALKCDVEIGWLVRIHHFRRTCRDKWRYVHFDRFYFSCAYCYHH